jgi:hypothetical protein
LNHIGLGQMDLDKSDVTGAQAKFVVTKDLKKERRSRVCVYC